MKKSILIFLMAKISLAEVFDPFYLKTNRDYIKQIAWVLKENKPLFYFDLRLENQIEALIFEAQKLKVYLKLEDKKLGKKYVKNKPIDFLPQIDLLKLSEHKIDFEYINIFSSDIYRTCAELTYAIRTKAGIYWLTKKQEERLNLLKDLKVQKLKINLTAINAKKPYRDIPVDEVIMVASDF
jgi:hypothetical protein